MSPLAAAEIADQVERWNRLYPVGTPVRVRVPAGGMSRGRVRRKAVVLADGRAAVWLDQWRCVLLSDVEPGEGEG